METDLLIALRNKIGMTQANLAKELDISIKTLKRWEKDGNISQRNWNAFRNFARLLVIASDAAASLAARARAVGRPKKTWRLGLPYGSTRIRLWKSGHEDHMALLECAPWGEEDMWVECRTTSGPNGLIRHGKRYRLTAGRPVFVADMAHVATHEEDKGDRGLCDIPPHHT